MLNTLKSKAWRAFCIAIAFVPWLASMYIFYWLDSSGTWTSETPHRGKISVALLSAGMGLSFLIYMALQRRNSE